MSHRFNSSHSRDRYPHSSSGSHRRHRNPPQPEEAVLYIRPTKGQQRRIDEENRRNNENTRNDLIKKMEGCIAEAEQKDLPPKRVGLMREHLAAARHVDLDQDSSSYSKDLETKHIRVLGGFLGGCSEKSVELKKASGQLEEEVEILKEKISDINKKMKGLRKAQEIAQDEIDAYKAGPSER